MYLSIYSFVNFNLNIVENALFSELGLTLT